MTFSEYMQLRERAEAVGIGDDKSLAQLLHYLQFREAATRNFQSYMNGMDSWCQNIVEEVESRIKEAEAGKELKSLNDSWEKLENDALKSSCTYFGKFEDQHVCCSTCPHGPNITGRGCGGNMRLELIERAKRLAYAEEQDGGEL